MDYTVSGVARVGHTDQLALSFINSKYTGREEDLFSLIII